MSGDMYTVPDPREFPRVALSDEPDWEPSCVACLSDWCDCEKFLAEGSVTLNGRSIGEDRRDVEDMVVFDEIVSLADRVCGRGWAFDPDVMPQVGGTSVAQGLGKYLAEMSESDRCKRKAPLLWGFREPSHVRWDEVLEFSRRHPQAWHEVRDRFDRKPRWKK